MLMCLTTEWVKKIAEKVETNPMKKNSNIAKFNLSFKNALNWFESTKYIAQREIAKAIIMSSSLIATNVPVTFIKGNLG